MGPGEKSARARRRAVPWLVLGLWVVLLAVVAPFAAKLSEVQHDRAVDYLPASADSTQVAKIQERLPGGETTELVLVYHREGGLSAGDRAAAEAQVAEIGERERLVAEPRGVPSEDGATVMYPVASNGPGTDEKLRDAFVERVRDVAHSDGGLTIEVGGPGALATDASKVYESLGGPLLYTTVAVVAVLLM